MNDKKFQVVKYHRTLGKLGVIAKDLSEEEAVKIWQSMRYEFRRSKYFFTYWQQ